MGPAGQGQTAPEAARKGSKPGQGGSVVCSAGVGKVEQPTWPPWPGLRVGVLLTGRGPNESGGEGTQGEMLTHGEHREALRRSRWTALIARLSSNKSNRAPVGVQAHGLPFSYNFSVKLEFLALSKSHNEDLLSAHMRETPWGQTLLHAQSIGKCCIKLLPGCMKET